MRMRMSVLCSIVTVAGMLALSVTAQPEENLLRDLGQQAAAQSSQKLGDMKAEIDKAVLSAGPNSTGGAYNAQGARMIRLGHGSGAKYCFGMALAEDPKNPFAAANLGFVFLRLKETDAAIKVLVIAAKQHPNCAEIHNNLAHALAAANKPEDALKELDAAAALQPRHPQIDYARAYFLDKLGRRHDAKRILEPIVARYAQHDAARALLDRIDKAIGKDEAVKPEGPFTGEREPNPAEAAAYVADMLRRYDQLAKETRAIHAEIAKIWTAADEASAKDEDDKRAKHLDALWKKAQAGDEAASQEFMELWGILPTSEAGGVFAACALMNPLPTPGYVDSLGDSLHDDEANELRANKAPGRQEVFDACGLLGNGISSKLNALIDRAWFTQHLTVCRPAIAGVREKLNASRAAMRDIHADVERQMKKIEHLKGDAWNKARDKISEDHRRKCARLVMEFRISVAQRGNAWKHSVDGHRGDVFKSASAALDEHERAIARLYTLVGRTEPSKEYLETMNRGIGVLNFVSGMPPRAAGLAGASMGTPDGFGVFPELYRKYARSALAASPEPGVLCTPSGIRWQKDLALVDYASCFMAFEAPGYKFTCTFVTETAQFPLRDWLEALGVNLTVVKIDAFGADISVGLDGNVSIGVGEGIKGAVEFNPFTGKMGVKVGWGYDVAGFGGGAFITLDNDKGLGWVAEIEAGAVTIPLAEGTVFQEVAPQ